MISFFGTPKFKKSSQVNIGLEVYEKRTDNRLNLRATFSLYPLVNFTHYINRGLRHGKSIKEKISK
jgi:hypothetical protein